MVAGNFNCTCGLHDGMGEWIKMTKYVIGCFSVPSGFCINEGDIVNVHGWQTGKIVRASAVKDITTKSPLWIMGDVPKAELAESFDERGVASNVMVLASGSVQFDLEVTKLNTRTFSTV